MKIPEWIKTTVSVCVLLFVLAVPFVYNKDKKDNAPFFAPIYSRTLSIAGQSLSVAYANTEASREQGLSYTDKLGSDQGMLFIFEEVVSPSFWMKDMNYPLDIIWIDKNKNVIGITKDIKPSTYPEKFSPPSEVLYVLEVNSGFSDLHNINVGDIVSF